MLYCLLEELCNHNLQDQKDKCVYKNRKKRRRTKTAIVP